MSAATVLLVDDEPSLRGLIQRMLVAAGYTVLEARNGAEALGLCASTKVDLVVSDVCMPHVDGVSLVHDLAGRDGAPRILVMSAEELTRQLPPGAVFLRKPFTRDDLLEHVRMTLEAGGPAASRV